jgi:hypothetical protein
MWLFPMSDVDDVDFKGYDGQYSSCELNYVSPDFSLIAISPLPHFTFTYM